MKLKMKTNTRKKNQNQNQTHCTFLTALSLLISNGHLAVARNTFFPPPNSNYFSLLALSVSTKFTDIFFSFFEFLFLSYTFSYVVRISIYYLGTEVAKAEGYTWEC
jgi:hypothetical protein